MMNISTSIIRRWNEVYAKTGIRPTVLRIGVELHDELRGDVPPCAGMNAVFLREFWGMEVRIDLRSSPRGFAIGYVHPLGGESFTEDISVLPIGFVPGDCR